MDYGGNPFASPEMQAMLQQQSQMPMNQGAYPYSGPELFGMMQQQAMQQQAMYQPQGGYSMYGVMPPQGGAPMGYDFMGRMDASGYVRYTRQQMLDGLRNYVVMQTGVPISKEEKLPETPQFLRHACAQCGISSLQMLTFQIPEAGISIPFYFCTACGKLFYYKDFAV